jgi:uncharacterized protein DUF6365
VDVVFYIEIGGGGDREGGTAHVGSFGEREHALSFARLIQRAGYRPQFVVGPLIEDHIRRAGFEPAVFRMPDEGIRIVKQIDPAMVIGCELFNLSPESARGLIDVSRSIGTIDGTSVSVPVNTDPFHTPEFQRSLVLPDDYYAFRPCPVNDIGANTDRIFHWSLFAGVERVAKDEQRYRSLNLDPSRTTVMLPVAPWAMGASFIFSLDHYYERLVAHIVDGLADVGGPVDLVFISLFRPPSLTVERQGSVDVHYPGLLPYDTYDHLLCSCDAIVTDNIISTSVSKAVVMGTPHLIIQNMQSSEMPYRYNMFPLKVLFPAEREYAQIVELAEFGNPPQIRERLARIVRNGHADEEARPRREAYIARLRRLADPADILEQIIGRPEPAGTPVS